MALPASDDFNRANESPIGGNWTNISTANEFRLLANEVLRLDTKALMYWNADSFDASHYSECKGISLSNAPAGPAVAVQPTTVDCFLIVLRNTSIQRFFKVVGGTETQLGADVSNPITTSSVCRIRIEGTLLTYSDDGVDIATRTDNSHSGGAAGLYDGVSQKFDDWGGGNVAAGVANPWYQYQQERIGAV